MVSQIQPVLQRQLSDCQSAKNVLPMRMKDIDLAEMILANVGKRMYSCFITQ